MPVPEFDQFVEYVTEGPVVHRVALTQHSLDMLPTLQAVASGYAHVEALGRAADLTPVEVTALQTQLTTLAYHSDMVRYATDATSAPGEIVATLVEVKSRPDWRAGIHVAVGGVYGYQGNLYEVIQAHDTLATWTPVVAKALFKRYYEPSDDPWPWVQPTGAHDRYRLGARVLHNGFVWRSENDANVWEPGSVGAEALWTNLTPPPATTEWVSGEQGIQIGDRRTYLGVTYECIQNPGVNIWPPPTVPALWRAL